MKKQKINCQMILQVLVQAYQQGGTTERKILSMQFPFHHPSSQEKEKSSIEHTFRTQGNEKN
jgi:hypothetical protein